MMKFIVSSQLLSKNLQNVCGINNDKQKHAYC